MLDIVAFGLFLELKSRAFQNFVVDGINLSEAGMSYIKSLSIDQPRKKRKKMSNIADMEAGILAAIESVVSGSSGGETDHIITFFSLCSVLLIYEFLIPDARPEALEADRTDETADKGRDLCVSVAV